jgi:hypothetical protein
MGRTLHAMGICASIFADGNFSKVPIETFAKTPGFALGSLKLDPVVSLNSVLTLPAMANVNMVWNAGGMSSDGGRSGWSGFMQSVCLGQHPSVSPISFLPIVNLPPTNENCILTTLVFISKQASIMNLKDVCVTFD